MLPTLTCRDVDVRRGAIIRPGPENPARRGQGRCARKKGPPRRTLLGPEISAVGAGVEQRKIDDRLTRPRCPWTNGQVERMNRTIKDATVKRYHYPAMTSSGSTCSSSWMPTTMDAGSRPCAASPPTSSSAGHGRKSPNASGSIHHTTCWTEHLGACPSNSLDGGSGG